MEGAELASVASRKAPLLTDARMLLRHSRYDRHPGSPLEVCAEIIGGKWKGPILFYLAEGPKRFGELRRLIPEVTQRVLTRQLRQLEKHGVVRRNVYAQVPPKVEYSLSDLGHSLDPILHVMRSWGAMYLKQHTRSIECSQPAISDGLIMTASSTEEQVFCPER